MKKCEMVRKEIVEEFRELLRNKYDEFMYNFSEHQGEFDVLLDDGNGEFEAYHGYMRDGSTQIHLSKAFLPPHLQNKGITKNLISIMFQVGKKYDCQTYVVQITNSLFYNKLLARQAERIDSDSVLITDATNLQ